MTAAALTAAWLAVSSNVRSLANYPPPPLDERVWEEAAAGRVARRTVAGDPATVIGIGILDITREEAWLSLTDDRLSAEVESLTEVALSGTWASQKRLYGRLDLPWPFLDRHWVIDLKNNAALARASGAWERSWTVANSALPQARDRTDAAAFDAAELVPVNDGAWLLIPLDDVSTLGIYQARVSMGGSIPSGAVDTYTRSSLDGLFSGVERNAANVRSRYTSGCAAQPGADGRPIPCFEPINPR